MLKILSRLIVLIYYRMFKLEDKVVFISFNGHYSDSPKALSEKMHELSPKTKQVWLVDKSKYNQMPQYVDIVDIKSIKATKELQTSKVVVDNTYCKKGFELGHGLIDSIVNRILVLFYTRKGQLLLTTWHGTPIKKIGADSYGSTASGFISPKMEMVNGNQHTLEIMQRITFGKINMLKFGSPRNDILFNNNNDVLKQKLSLPLDKKVILFAPTFRSDKGELGGKNVERSGLNQLKSIDFNKLFETLQKKFNGDWVFVGRFHYFVENKVNWGELECKYPGKIINGNKFDDMAEYLACTDVLLSDCSSCLTDFALTHKPCFIYFPDMEHYETSERGFYFKINDLPFPASKDFDGLLKNIETFDEKKYREEVTEFFEKIGNYDKGNSSESVVKEIILKN